MSIDIARAYLEKLGYADRIREFDVSSATVELAAKAVGTEPARICKTLPEGMQITAMTELGQKIFPFFDLGLGWVVPSLIGLVIGLVITAVKKNKGEKVAA